MFKSGQLVRKKIGTFKDLTWVITERRYDGNCVIASTRHSRFDFIDEKFLELIGNNYKPKSIKRNV